MRDRTDEDDAVVPARALAAAQAVLAATPGTRERADVAARFVALGVLEDAYGPIDPPPALGRTITSEKFRSQLVERGGVVPPSPELLP
jgi:hypothetical protein